MLLWQLFLIAGLAFLILEMFVPMMFFLNFAIGAFITAAFAVFAANLNVLIPIFLGISVILLIFFRPFLAKHTHPDKTETGVQAQYIGKVVKAIEPINEFSGAVTIYDERWAARSLKGEIPDGAEVKVVKNEGLTLFVEKI